MFESFFAAYLLNLELDSSLFHVIPEQKAEAHFSFYVIEIH